jgi:hypothetical protein
MTHIFFSYARIDSAIADQIVYRLEKNGYHVWIDRSDISGGDQWRRKIVDAIDKASTFIVLLSPQSVRSDNVRKEIDLAEHSQTRIVPIRIQAAEIPKEFLYQLVGLQIIDLSSNVDKDFSKLLEALGQKIPREVKARPSTRKVQRKKVSDLGDRDVTFRVPAGKLIKQYIIGVVIMAVIGGILVLVLSEGVVEVAIYCVGGILIIGAIYSFIVVGNMAKHRVSINTHYITAKNTWGNVVSIPWNEITKVKQNNASGFNTLHASYGKMLTALVIPLNMENMRGFKSMVIEIAGPHHPISIELQKKVR